MGYVIDEIFAYIATDNDGDEGIIVATMEGRDLPLVGSELMRVMSFAPLAKAACGAAGLEYKLKHFRLLGDVSDEYIEQYENIEEPAEEVQLPGNADSDKRQPDDTGGANGGGKNVH